MEENQKEEEKREAAQVESQEGINGKLENGDKNKKTLMAMAVIGVILLIAAIPMFERYQLANSTETDFSSVQGKIPDEDLNRLKEQYTNAKAILQKDGLNYEANLKKADVLVQINEFEKAEKIYKKLGELRPKDTLPLESLGALYFTQAKYKEAEAAYEKALTINAQDLEAYLQLVELYDNTHESKEKINKLFQDGINNLGSDKDKLIALYIPFLEEGGEYEKAVEQVNVLLAEKPEDGDLKAKLAELKTKVSMPTYEIQPEPAQAQPAASPDQPALVPAQ